MTDYLALQIVQILHQASLVFLALFAVFVACEVVHLVDQVALHGIELRLRLQLDFLVVLLHQLQLVFQL